MEIRLSSEFTRKPTGDGFTSSLGEQTKRLTINVHLQCLGTKVGDRIGIDYSQIVGSLISCMDPGLGVFTWTSEIRRAQKLVLVRES